MQTDPLHFRDAMLDDAAAIADLVNSAYSGPDAARGWTPETHLHAGPRTTLAEVRGILADPHHRILLCHAPDLAGSVQIDASGHLGMLAVHPLRQAEGIGRALLDHAETRAVSLWGVPSLTLTAINLQTALIAYSERRGFRRTGRREAFPHDEQPGALRQDFDLIELTKPI
ncbi:GNAT family N-acetyltransferase [Tabrizicola sp.]|uniref:GNAT family N-acetyltransferase n=1 Tax=Tabrizicola sp. TaxID=2005166 RepID=UPI002733D924|nr:GNAT family N-acetyltransferase [Tabrizicola sp.]MDP3194069.1 GNAT family N-acetyltransferase [Tabrizicola sp.]MDZ4069049.1 GNAT family N-acetyltransferase [Tabrizicola sp.]